MISPNRQARRARDRKISIALAIIIGVAVGVGAWVMLQRKEYIPKEAAIEVARVAKPKGEKLILAPHKALYNVDLVKARNGSQIIDIRGQMFFKLHQGCDAYLADHRFVLTYNYADSEPMRVTSDFSTQESIDGGAFDFSSRRRRDGDLYQELRGQAVRGGGTATYSEPEDLKFDLPTDIVFPSGHTKALIAAAKAGKKFYATTLFDGSDDQGPVDVTAVIGKRVTAQKKVGAIDTSLVASPGWHMHLAFFPRRSQKDTADYELSMVLHENGIISSMTIDYQEFTVDQTLTALTPEPPEVCDGRTAAATQRRKPEVVKLKPAPEIDLPLR